MASEGNFDPCYFVVVLSDNWKNEGRLPVTLDDDNLECKPDRFFVDPTDPDLLLVNLQIANMDWSEIKENYELKPEDNQSEDEQFTHEKTSDKEDYAGIQLLVRTFKSPRLVPWIKMLF